MAKVVRPSGETRFGLLVAKKLSILATPGITAHRGENGLGTSLVYRVLYGEAVVG